MQQERLLEYGMRNCMYAIMHEYINVKYGNKGHTKNTESVIRALEIACLYK